MKNGKFDLKTFLNNIELYLATLCFIVLTAMLTLQVFSRFILHHSWTWMEEFATIMFVWMIYLAISAAVTYRKHLRIDFLLDMMPFKVKKVMLIISNVIFALFNVYISVIMFNVIKLLGASKTTMLKIPAAGVHRHSHQPAARSDPPDPGHHQAGQGERGEPRHLQALHGSGRLRARVERKESSDE